MKNLRVLYHMARADFLERVRSYRFLVILGLVVFLGYQVNTGVMGLYLDEYRGVFNSAWIGSMLTVVGTFFFGWLGFYVVKGSIARDVETGVGQIVATTPMSRLQYMLGKWLSNLAVLTIMMSVLAGFGFIMQFIQREDSFINPGALISPFLIVGLPAMALVAALATLFDGIRWLRGGLGNVVYFFLFSSSLGLALESVQLPPALEPLGTKLFSAEMGAAVRQKFPDYSGGFSIGSTDRTVVGTFEWNGLPLRWDIVFWRLTIIAAALILVVFSAAVFDRFDSSDPKRTSRTIKKSAPDLSLNSAPPEMAGQRSLSSLPEVQYRFSFTDVLLAEIKLMLKGQPRWWYGVSVVLMVLGLFNRLENVREIILPFTWIWPILIWSNMGVRELRYSTHQIVFSAPRPLTRQLPAIWLAGVSITALIGIGSGLRLMLSGDGSSIGAWFAAVLFIPSLALVCGVWSRSSKLFEVLYLSLWYLGPLNHIDVLDYIGSRDARPLVWLLLGIVMLVFAALGRQQQIKV